jgi:drug/metabolite transporter (DMT)-like permease
MTSHNVIWLGLLFGIISTSVLHLAKAMERHGIEVFSRKKSFKQKGKKPMIYIIGFILNNTIMVWQIIGMTFASAAVFSSVFGLGLIILMIYSHYILKEEIQQIELIGAIFILIGTTSSGIFYIFEKNPPNQTVNYINFYVLLATIFLIFFLLVTFSLKTHIGIAVIFGIVAGTLGGIDNIFKRLGLTTGNFIEAFAGVFRLEPLSFIFLLSFLIGFLAFFFTQLGFAKGADASKLVPMYNSLYIISPIVIEFVIIRNMKISIGIVVSVIIIVIGIFLMNLFKRPVELKKNHQTKNGNINWFLNGS